MADGNSESPRLREAFRALRYYNFRLFFAGQLISLVGTWMQTVAQSWLVYRLTGSSALLGLVGFSSQIPVFLFSPLGGVAADRHNRHRMIIVTQSLSMLAGADSGRPHPYRTRTHLAPLRAFRDARAWSTPSTFPRARPFFRRWWDAPI